MLRLCVVHDLVSICIFSQRIYSCAFPSIYLIERMADTKLNCFILAFTGQRAINLYTIKASFHLNPPSPAINPSFWCS